MKKKYFIGIDVSKQTLDVAFILVEGEHKASPVWKVFDNNDPGLSCMLCPGFVRTPLVEKQIPEQAKELGISEDEVIKNVMLKDTVDGVFTTVEDIAQTALYLATFPSAALTGQSIVVSHGWFMQ